MTATSGSRGREPSRPQLRRHQPIQADALLGGLDRKATVNILGHADFELAREPSRGEGFGNFLSLSPQVRHDPSDDAPNALERLFVAGAIQLKLGNSAHSPR